MQAQLNTRLVRVPGAQIRQHIGALYIMTGDDEAFELTIQSFASSSQKMFLFPFKPIQVKDSFAFQDDALRKTFKDIPFCFATLIPNPVAGEPVFLVQPSVDGFLAIEAMNFVCEADKQTRSALSEFATRRPDIFLDELNEYLVTTLGGTGLGAILTSGFPSIANISFTGREKRLTKEEKEEQARLARDSFVENVRQERITGDTKISKTVDIAINSLPNSTKLLIIRKYIDTLSEEELQKLYEDNVNLKKIAESSKVKIVVRKRFDGKGIDGKYEDLTITRGDYRICYQYGDEKEDHLFDFYTRPECAVYLCCLISRFKYGDKNVVFDDLKEMFIGAYRFLYGETYEQARTEYDLLPDLIDPKSGSLLHQGCLKNHISNIRKVIDAELLYKENPSIFYFKKNSHLEILKENIKLPKGILKTVLELGRDSVI